MLTHIYTNVGVYTVTFTVRDDDGDESTVTEHVTISAVAMQEDPCDPAKTALMVSGTSGDDKIRFVPQGNKGEIKVLINGKFQGTFTLTGSIIAFGLAGDDDIEVAGSIGLTAIFFGGDGNDRLKGGAGSSVLCGDAGDDLLIGGSGRSVLIGGAGAARLVGNSGDDILIAGTTAYGCDLGALCAILDEWTRSDRTHAERVSNLANGGGLNGNITLNARTVIDDDAYDVLTGSAGMDWFFAGANDKATDKPEVVSDASATLLSQVAQNPKVAASTEIRPKGK